MSTINGDHLRTQRLPSSEYSKPGYFLQSHAYVSLVRSQNPGQVESHHAKMMIEGQQTVAISCHGFMSLTNTGIADVDGAMQAKCCSTGIAARAAIAESCVV
jgi:hypothetical protein